MEWDNFHSLSFENELGRIVHVMLVIPSTLMVMMLIMLKMLLMVMTLVMCSNLSKTSDTNCHLISCMSCVAAHFLQTEH